MPASRSSAAPGAPCARARSIWTCRSRSASCWRSACRWSRRPTTPTTPISIPRSCCCSSCCSAARSTTRCGARRAPSPATSRRLKAEIGAPLRRTASWSSVPVGGAQAGDRVLVRPGDRVPADGIVHQRAPPRSTTASITGETARAPVAAGAQVYAGSVNFDGALTVRVRPPAAARCSTRSSGCSRRPRSAIALPAARRPRRAHLCAGRACHRALTAARLAARRRGAARRHHHRDRRAHHHLSLRAGAEHFDQKDAGSRVTARSPCVMGLGILDILPFHCHHRTTTLTSLPATTITLATCLPSVAARTFSSASTRSRTASSGVSAGKTMWLRSLPLTWTA